jgi:hypothetical protein
LLDTKKEQLCSVTSFRHDVLLQHSPETTELTKLELKPLKTVRQNWLFFILNCFSQVFYHSDKKLNDKVINQRLVSRIARNTTLLRPTTGDLRVSSSNRVFFCTGAVRNKWFYD